MFVAVLHTRSNDIRNVSTIFRSDEFVRARVDIDLFVFLQKRAHALPVRDLGSIYAFIGDLLK